MIYSKEEVDMLVRIHLLEWRATWSLMVRSIPSLLILIGLIYLWLK